MKLRESKHADGTHHSWLFLCPGCGGAVHQCDKRWTFNGDVDRPSFVGSVLVHAVPDIQRPRCHSHVTDGRIAYCADSEHALAGQTVDLPEWPADGSWPDGAL